MNKFNRLYKFAIELPDPKDTNVHVHDIGRYEDENGFVSTVAIVEGFGGDKRDRYYACETAIKGNNDISVVEKYDSVEEAVAGHEKWVKAYKEWWSGDLLNKSNESKTYNADDGNSKLYNLIKEFAAKYDTTTDELYEVLLADDELSAIKAFCKSKNLGKYICKLLLSDSQFRKDCNALIMAKTILIKKDNII